MLRKFLSGLVFGTGLAIALIVVWTIYLKFFLVASLNSATTYSEHPTKTINQPPIIEKTSLVFLGSSGIYSGDFIGNRNDTLAEGPGTISGKIYANDKPINGVRIRLALNGKVMSSWATSKNDGTYRIRVPYGEYKIDGYELDSLIVDKYLPGLIDKPSNTHSSGTFLVNKEKSGIGIDLYYVKPIVKLDTPNSFDTSGPVKISWEEYPGAAKYRIQVYGKQNPHEYLGRETVFPWGKNPTTSDTTIDLRAHTDKLKQGMYYSYEVQAIDSDGKQLSETPRSHQGYDFQID